MMSYSEQERDYWKQKAEKLEAEVERLREALQSIAGKRRPSGEYCQRVATLALSKTPSSDIIAPPSERETDGE